MLMLKPYKKRDKKQYFKFKSRSRQKPKSVLMFRICVLIAVTGLFSTWLQMHHVLDNHHLEPSSSHLPSPGNSKLAFHSQSKKTDAKKSDTFSEIDDDVNDELKPILEILSEAGYDITKNSKEIDRSVLPKWSEILRGYGPPKILGLESCQAYRDSVAFDKRRLAVAGLFNSGTNLLSALLDRNCEHDGEKKSVWQVPWGKHVPFYNRTNHLNYGLKKKGRTASPDEVMPVVTIRDPYTWLQSMCRQPYAVQYEFSKSSCPNLIPYPSDIVAHPRFRKKKYTPVFVGYDSKLPKIKHESMGHLWNEWYNSYIEFNRDDQQHTNKATMKTPTVPFVLVRMEDLVFHAKTVVPQLCECIGGSMKNSKVRYVSETQNKNSGIDTSAGSGLLRSVVNYGNITKRRDGYAAFQLKAAKDILDSRILDLLGYPFEEP